MININFIKVVISQKGEGFKGQAGKDKKALRLLLILNALFKCYI